MPGCGEDREARQSQSSATGRVENDEKIPNLLPRDMLEIDSQLSGVSISNDGRDREEGAQPKEVPLAEQEECQVNRRVSIGANIGAPETVSNDVDTEAKTKVQGKDSALSSAHGELTVSPGNKDEDEAIPVLGADDSCVEQHRASLSKTSTLSSDSGDASMHDHQSAPSGVSGTRFDAHVADAATTESPRSGRSSHTSSTKSFEDVGNSVTKKEAKGLKSQGCNGLAPRHAVTKRRAPAPAPARSAPPASSPSVSAAHKHARTNGAKPPLSTLTLDRAAGSLRASPVVLQRLRDGLSKYGVQFSDMFSAYDADADGRVDKREWRRVFAAMCVQANQIEIDALFDEIADGIKSVSYRDLVRTRGERPLRRNIVSPDAGVRTSCAVSPARASGTATSRRAGCGSEPAAVDACAPQSEPQLLLRLSLTRVGVPLVELCAKHDSDADGFITAAEWRKVVRAAAADRTQQSQAEADALFGSLLADGEASLPYHQLSRRLRSLPQASMQPPQLFCLPSSSTSSPSPSPPSPSPPPPSATPYSQATAAAQTSSGASPASKSFPGHRHSPKQRKQSSSPFAGAKPSGRTSRWSHYAAPNFGTRQSMERDREVYMDPYLPLAPSIGSLGQLQPHSRGGSAPNHALGRSGGDAMRRSASTPTHAPLRPLASVARRTPPGTPPGTPSTHAARRTPPQPASGVHTLRPGGVHTLSAVSVCNAAAGKPAPRAAVPSPLELAMQYIHGNMRDKRAHLHTQEWDATTPLGYSPMEKSTAVYDLQRMASGAGMDTLYSHKVM